MNKALLNYGTRGKLTPVTTPLADTTQVPNWGGGHAWEIDDLAKLRRFLILGIEDGTMYASESKLVKYNGDAVVRAVDADGQRVVQEIVDVSEAGRALKNDPALFALAVAASQGDLATRRAAFAALPRVARTGTHLLHFAEYLKGFRGKGRAYRHGLAKWFTEQPVAHLAYQMVKYRHRDGWTQRDMLRVAHPKTDDPVRNTLFRWVTKGATAFENNEVDPEGGLRILVGYEAVQKATTGKEVANLIRDYNLPREAVPTQWLNDKNVWLALLDDMPMTALIRNLGKLSSIGLLESGSQVARDVVAQLSDTQRIRKARVHPLQMLIALKVYEQGHGERGSLTWTPVTKVIDALDAGFYAAFGNVEATGKFIVLGVDVSGSMQWGSMAGLPGITPGVGAAACALVTAAVEPNAEILGFGSTVRPIDISAKMRLDTVVAKMGFNMGSTNCSLPIVYALEHKWDKVDAFVTYTDNEVNTGFHTKQLLDRYRHTYARVSKFVTVGMTSNGFSIADPNDAYSLDVVGFDANTPAAISAFIAG